MPGTIDQRGLFLLLALQISKKEVVLKLHMAFNMCKAVLFLFLPCGLYLILKTLELHSSISDSHS